jgi:hypothetical protein
MGHQRVFPAAADGRPHGNSPKMAQGVVGIIGRLLCAAAVMLGTASFGSTAHAQAGPFGLMAGNWAGGGVVTLDDGSRERIRCRASYVVAGPSMNMTLTCASDAYKFNLQANVVDQGGSVSGTWTESGRGVAGTLQGRGGGNNFDIVASAAGFNASISVHTAGAKQSIVMRADNQFRGASIAMSR